MGFEIILLFNIQTAKFLALISFLRMQFDKKYYVTIMMMLDLWWRCTAGLVVSVVPGGKNRGNDMRTSHGRISMKHLLPWTTDTKSFDRPWTAW